MTGRWWEPYDRAAARGAVMRTHTRGCTCTACRAEQLWAAKSAPGAGEVVLAPGRLPSP